MPFRMGLWEISLILLIVLITFGAGKLPQISGTIGKSLRAFRKAQSGEGDDTLTKAAHKSEKYAAKPRLKTS